MLLLTGVTLAVGVTVLAAVGATIVGAALSFLAFIGADAWVAKLSGNPAAYNWWEGTGWESRDSAAKSVVVAIGMAVTLVAAMAGTLGVIGLIVVALQCVIGHCPSLPH